MDNYKGYFRWESVKSYFTDPSLLTLEVLFIVLTLSNVYVVHTLFVTVLPAPLFVTWWQLAQGLWTAWVLGDFGASFPKLAYFPPVNIDSKLLKELFMPTVSYVAMLSSANVLLSKAPSTAAFPILASGAVAAHHAARFVACGEEYMPLRWKAVGFLLLAFVLGATDSKVAPGSVVTVACLYALLAAVFRAGCMERALHVVNGKGNALHNHQHLIGALLLPLAIVFSGEFTVLVRDLPFDPFAARTWQVWGCFFTVGALPFMKNVVSNRLIRQTGQAPWRCLELVSVALLFVIGSAQLSPSWRSVLATVFVLAGRFLGALDVVKNMSPDSEPTEMYNQATKPFLEEEHSSTHELA
ncbi:putative integral membrane protein [Theileria parva strain Muguga]|uniref:Uncharacterized protein n=1 Tax=Theileria parva TaxID=5875 RepID=Q4N2S3_THEPA|nr:putative integral membrane protein [Theileria parva strain Muguga]EAN31625.1 putative integral membrane protein [Theileria parva strain Muguga]|eukprot:XP_763908.1 hypothetical protein [Theileria parva strain Muguga]